jgi:hypothetical protein
MPDAIVYDEASSVDAEDGAVILSGPGEVTVSLTPDAAEETADRLNENAMKARGQRYFKERGK